MKIKTLLAAAACVLALGAGEASAASHRLLVISVDGLDWRYLRDRDPLGLSIPNIRKLLTRSEVADGVTGVWPTVTWPSHTSMLTGVRPAEHGILANAGGPPDPALSYWSANKIKVPTLTQCLVSSGRTVGAVNWPVTVDAGINWNLPEVYARRNGDSSDMDTVDHFGTPGLVAEIGHTYPSFAQQWLDDRSRALATIFLLKQKHPDLLLLHFAELDSEEHEEGPFTPHAKAVVERTDELIGDILKMLPKGYDLALVSDHGFERVDHIAGLKAMAVSDGVTGQMTITPGLVTTGDPAVAAWLRQKSGKDDVGREVSAEELARYAPLLSGTAFEPAPHVMFGDGPARSSSNTIGNHGFWPMRADYHSIFLLSGPGIKPRSLGTIEMVSLKDRFAAVLGVGCPTP
jgi:predicted AlkP superfamily pyrophosphatase or phosphodiesterase